MNMSKPEIIQTQTKSCFMKKKASTLQSFSFLFLTKGSNYMYKQKVSSEFNKQLGEEVCKKLTCFFVFFWGGH